MQIGCPSIFPLRRPTLKSDRQPNTGRVVALPELSKAGNLQPAALVAKLAGYFPRFLGRRRHNHRHSASNPAIAGVCAAAQDTVESQSFAVKL